MGGMFRATCLQPAAGNTEPVPGGNLNNAGVIIINFIYTDFNISLMIEIKPPHVKTSIQRDGPIRRASV